MAGPERSNALDRFSGLVGKAASWLTLFMVIVTFIVVVLRYVFDIGFIWVQESIIWMHAVVFMLGAAYTLREDEHVSWDGHFRASLHGEGVYPRPLQDPLPVWIAVGGSPESAFRAGTLGVPMALAIIGGMPERFAPFVQLFRDAAREAGHDPAPPVSINSHGYIAATAQEALDDSWPYAASMMNRIGRERGWQPMAKEHYDAAADLRGANFVGSPQQIVDKILFQHEVFHHDRFLVQFTVGSMPHAKIMRSIELLGTEVAPAVRAALPA